MTTTDRTTGFDAKAAIKEAIAQPRERVYVAALGVDGEEGWEVRERPDCLLPVDGAYMTRFPSVEFERETGHWTHGDDDRLMDVLGETIACAQRHDWMIDSLTATEAWLSREVLPEAIERDHQLHDEGEKPSRGFNR